MAQDQIEATTAAPTVAARPVAGERERRWRMLRRSLAVGYAGVLVWFIAVYGVPLDRIGLTLWVLGGLGISVLGRGWRAFGRILLDWLPFTGILIAYDYTRGLAGHYGGALVQGAVNALGFPLHVTEPATFDRWLFGGTVPTVWLQHHLYTHGWVHWYDLVVTLVYLSHFLATPVIAMVLWIRHRDRFRGWVGCVVAMAVLGVATYIVYPMAPPWMASEQGVIAPINRISGLGWSYLDLGVARQVLSNSQALANPVAAMPSLHTGYAAMVAFFFMAGAPWWRRVLLACYPLLMGWALIYSGEHYVLDVLAGMVYAAVIVGVWLALRRWRRGRRDPGDRAARLG
ncbi:MAG TPA: phosphatase PAP2 family protein [Segeticoccus sp.]|uniref:phosphatase PAP2 family protein n=1 Tax=Segeticoccus sp. TaxID=2706531 RepID=UPI002D801DA6|nr:phosphatase PAP2 family protein [Segeticoccus sp.]HET8600798.1 phosphatase PAP2 family protein [Segeticoccus sp.]